MEIRITKYNEGDDIFTRYELTAVTAEDREFQSALFLIMPEKELWESHQLGIISHTGAVMTLQKRS